MGHDSETHLPQKLSIIKGEIHLLTKKNINTSLILQKNISMIPKFSAKYSVD